MEKRKEFGKIADAMEDKLEKISTAALNFLVPQDTQEMYAIIVKEAVELLGGTFGSVILGNGKDMVRVYTSNHALFSSRVRRGSNSYKSYSEQKILVIPIEKLSAAHPELAAEKIKSTVFIPLSYQQKATGVLIVNSRNVINLTLSDMHLLSLYGAMASLAIRKTQLYNEMKNALDTRDHFISLASHELRTPLTSINGYIQLLHSKMKDQNTSESKWVSELSNESKRLTNLVFELMEINRIKQGTLQFNLQENNLNEFFEDLQKQVGNPSERNIIFENQLKTNGQTFVGDTEKLQNVIIGLIDNADKFSPKNTPITVSVSANSSRLCIEVQDRGRGLSREDITKIFDGFHKVEQREGDGFGVGLLLAKHIIKFHHGTIDVHSKPKKGTTVEITLPLITQ